MIKCQVNSKYQNEIVQISIVNENLETLLNEYIQPENLKQKTTYTITKNGKQYTKELK